MDPSWTAVAAGLAVLVAGALGFAAARGGDLVRRRNQEDRERELLPGAVAVLSVLPSAAMILDSGDDVLNASSTAYAFGLVRGQELVHPELRRIVGDARRAGLVRECELELARGPLGGGRLVLQVRVAPLDSGNMLVLVEDRSEARRLEKIRHDFVANVSHELKTPIGALRLLSEAVYDAAEEAEAVRHFAEQMERESLRLTTLVQEIIDLSRVQVADTLHPPELVEVDVVVTEALDRCLLGAQRKRMEIRIAGDAGAVVFGDHELLVTALRNLIGNAVAYSAEGTTVEVEVRRVGGLVEITVRDQGIGIAREEQSRIFERFYRVDKARSRATGGTGLGLSIVKHVADNHGGEVTVHSVEGQGSTFTLRLPEGASPSGDVVGAVASVTPGGVTPTFGAGRTESDRTERR